MAWPRIKLARTLTTGIEAVLVKSKMSLGPAFAGPFLCLRVKRG